MKSFPAVIALALPALLAACSGGSEQEEVAPQEPSSQPAPMHDALAAAPAAFNTCRSCHSVEPGRNIVGPTLHGIVGSKAAEVEGYPFSPALRNSGIVWTRDALDRWLQGPMTMVPGTKMVMSVPNAQARKDIIDYLETLK
jgi:cytochrome c